MLRRLDTALVQRRFIVETPDSLWLTDITEHPTREGKVYCAAVMDAYSRFIIGWSIDYHLKTELVLAALDMALLRRKPPGESTILHSDHGTRRGHSGNDFAMPDCSVRWAPSAIATTMP